MKAKPLFLILIACLLVIVSTSTAQQTVFNKVYYLDEGIHVLGSDTSPDKGYVMVGKKYDDTGHLIKIDSAGSVEWTRQLSGTGNYAEIDDVVCNPDSTIVTAGFVYSMPDALITVIKWDKYGDTLWSVNLEGLASIEDIRIRKSSTGGYLIVASNSFYYSLSNVSTLALKINENGDLMWSKTYTSNDYMIFLTSVGELSDNNLILTGYRRNNETNRDDLLIIKTDENGNVLWSEALSESVSYIGSEGVDIAVTQDGIVLFANFYNNNSGLIKLDINGGPVWAINNFLNINSIWTNSRGTLSGTPDGGFVLISPGFMEGQLLKADDTGTPQWLQAVFMDAVDVAISSDGGYMVFGNGPIYGVKTAPDYIPQIGAYKTDETGNSSECVYPLIQQSELYTAIFENFNTLASDIGNPVSTTLSINSFTLSIEDTCVAFTGGIKETEKQCTRLNIYPNPTSGLFSINIANGLIEKPDKLVIISPSGNIIYSTTDPSCLRNGVNPGYLPDGIYLVRLISGNGAYTGKLLIRH